MSLKYEPASKQLCASNSPSAPDAPSPSTLTQKVNIHLSKVNSRKVNFYTPKVNLWEALQKATAHKTRLPSSPGASQQAQQAWTLTPPPNANCTW